MLLEAEKQRNCINAKIEELNSFNQRKAQNTKDDGSTCRELQIAIKHGFHRSP